MTQRKLMKMIKNKSGLNLLLVTMSCVLFIFCSQVWADKAARFTAEENVSWDNAYNNSTKERFIPVELFTGGTWDGKHELILKEVSTTACATVSGRKRPCDNYYITGPFKTERNDTKIEWAGDEISYYRRTFSTRSFGNVESLFTINNSRDGLVRMYDNRKQWGARTYDGLGSKFPLGFWKQGEVRSYASRRPTRIEIIELDGPNHCLTFRWTIGLGKGKNSDNNYTFCPGRGFTNISHNIEGTDSTEDAETIKTYCSPADNLNWVIGKDECLKITTLNRNESVSLDTLVVYLHGDGSRTIRRSDYLKHGVSRINQKNVAHIILMRPGYYDSTRNSSTGISDRRSRRGTSYNSHNVEEIALAIKKLKDYHKPNKIIIVGHSGGAAIAALILGRHPGIANGAILAACPCNANKWAQMGGKRSGKGALSPHDYVENIGADVTVIALTGKKVDNAFSILAVEYIEKLKKNIVNAKFIGVEGETHDGVVRSPQFYNALNEILK
jgi:pimeloyl-ACP methyl ester carboxylesterase